MTTCRSDTGPPPRRHRGVSDPPLLLPIAAATMWEIRPSTLRNNPGNRPRIYMGYNSPQDLHRLHLTLASQRPKLLILDPFVRLQRADENDARQVAAILASLRELARTFNAAVLLVHHARKSGAALPGQALRGSGDFWAWGDSNLYLSGRPNRLRLTVEHRAAPPPAPLSLHLLATDHPRAGQPPLRLEPQDHPELAKIPVKGGRVLCSRSRAPSDALAPHAGSHFRRRATDPLRHRRRHSRSMNTLSIHRPRPSIEQRIPAVSSNPVNAPFRTLPRLPPTATPSRARWHP